MRQFIIPIFPTEKDNLYLCTEIIRMHICENDHFICNNLVIYHLCNERAEIHTFRTMTRKNRKYSKCALRCSKNEAIYHLISIFFNQITYIHSLYLLSLHYKETCIILQIYKTYKNYQILVKVDLFIDAKKKKKKEKLPSTAAREIT